MARSQHRSLRKISGGRYHYVRTKKKYERAGFSSNTKVEKTRKVVKTRVMGSNQKLSLLQIHEINLANKQGKTAKAEILKVIENPANPNLVRRNIITRGSIVETSLGKARVTSRPGQEGSVNGVLLA